MSKTDADDMQRLYELYLVDCEASKLTPSVRDFTIWLQENYES